MTARSWSRSVLHPLPPSSLLSLPPSSSPSFSSSFSSPCCLDTAFPCQSAWPRACLGLWEGWDTSGCCYDGAPGALRYPETRPSSHRTRCELLWELVSCPEQGLSGALGGLNLRSLETLFMKKNVKFQVQNEIQGLGWAQAVRDPEAGLSDFPGKSTASQDQEHRSPSTDRLGQEGLEVIGCSAGEA